jgi:hypothetical protein
MLHFLQPAATLFIGLALSVYGLIHSVRHAPQASAFQAAIQAMPDAIAVIVFGFGIAAIIAGVILLIGGIKGIRSRARDINRAYGQSHPGPRNGQVRDPRDQYGYDDDWGDHPALR